MDHHQLSFILLLLLTTVTAKQSIITDSFFNMLEEGHPITGKVDVKVSTKSKIHCSIICLSTETCKAYRYTGTGPGNCILISQNSTTEEGDIFEINGISFIYEKNICKNGCDQVTTDIAVHCEEEDNGYTCSCSQDSGGTWSPPSGGNGPDPVLYRSFDNMDGLVLMEGNQQRNYAELIVGQVNCALTLNHTRRQWIDLGVHTEACMTSPETCGLAGGVISLWVNVIDCPSVAGILSTRQPPKRGFLMYCSGSTIRFEIFISNGIFSASPSVPTGWTHIVLNYHGPYHGDGIRIHYDGAEVASGTSKVQHGGTSREGRIVVVGRYYTNTDENYASIQVDELIFFNQIVSPSEIFALYK